MPERIYVGGHDAVEIAVNNEVLVAVRDGAPVTVDAATAAEMDAAGIWKTPSSASKSSVKE